MAQQNVPINSSTNITQKMETDGSGNHWPDITLVDQSSNPISIALDGTDSTDTNAIQATGGIGIRGWLSTLTSLFRGGGAQTSIRRLLLTQDTVAVGPAATGTNIGTSGSPHSFAIAGDGSSVMGGTLNYRSVQIAAHLVVPASSTFTLYFYTVLLNGRVVSPWNSGALASGTYDFIVNGGPGFQKYGNATQLNGTVVGVSDFPCMLGYSSYFASVGTTSPTTGDITMTFQG